MTLKVKLYIYLIVIHLLALSLAFYFNEQLEFWLIAVEIMLLLTLVLGLKLIKQALEPLDFIQTFSDVLKESEYSSRFSPVGQIEMDELIKIYNIMLTQLYNERLKLGEQKGILSKILEASPTSIIIFDFDNKIALLNSRAEKLIQVKNDDAVGKRLSYFNSSLCQQLTHITTDHSKLITINNGNRMRVQKGSFRDRGFERTFMFIEELSVELEKTEKATYEKLIRIMSHEVNNTIAATNSLLSSCLNYSTQINQNDQKDYTNALTVVINRSDNLNQFMQGYASLIRVPKPEVQSFDLIDLVENSFAIFSTQLNQRKIIFKNIIETNNTEVIADSHLIEQVLINLIKNAMEAIETDGEIICYFNSSTTGLIFSIEDTGPGLSNIALDDLFTPFFSTKNDGQGLGLILVKEILTAHNFLFSLENKNEKGACFSIIFSY